MKIGFYTIAYTEGGYSTKQLDSILPYTKHEIVTDLYLHNSRSEQLIEECEQLTDKYHINYFPYGINRGINKSTNESLYRGFHINNCDIMIGASQDVYFNSPTAFDNWIEKAKPHIDKMALIGNHTSQIDTAYCAMAILTRNFINNIGYTDENFVPAQYDDIDNMRRLSLVYRNKPFQQNIVSDSTHDGMLSRRKDMSLFIQQTYITFPLCEQYYIRKWGAIHNEPYTHPFNDPSLNCYIPWEKHSAPYGKYDRKDQNIVRI
jgi:hypothetical protein